MVVRKDRACRGEARGASLSTVALGTTHTRALIGGQNIARIAKPDISSQNQRREVEDDKARRTRRRSCLIPSRWPELKTQRENNVGLVEPSLFAPFCPKRRTGIRYSRPLGRPVRPLQTSGTRPNTSVNMARGFLDPPYTSSFFQTF